MRAQSSAVLVTVSMLAVACGARPQAELAYIATPDDLNGREIDTYAFPRTYIDLPAPDAQGRVEANVRQLPYEGFRIAVRPRSSVGVRTRVSMSKKKNSDLLDQAGVEVIDNRVKLLGEVAGIIKGIIAIAPISRTQAESQTPATPAKLPTSMNTLVLLPANEQASPGNPDDPKTWSTPDKFIRYWFGPVSPDARLVTAGDIASMSNGLVYAACREMRLKFALANADNQVQYSYNLFVSDPRYYRFAAFPAKGSIQVHDQCGVSVTSTADGVSSDTAVLLTLVNQLNEIKAKLDQRDRR